MSIDSVKVRTLLDIRFLALPAHSKVPVSRKKAKAKRKLKAFKAARKSARKK